MSDMLRRLSVIPTQKEVGQSIIPFNSALTSTSFAASSNFLKSFVFCARSFRCTVESRWYCTISEAVLSRLGIIEVRSIPEWLVNTCSRSTTRSTHSATLRWLSGTCCHHLDLYLYCQGSSPLGQKLAHPQQHPTSCFDKVYYLSLLQSDRDQPLANIGFWIYWDLC